MYASREELSGYLGREAGLDVPVHIATENMDLSADLKRALAHARAGKQDQKKKLSDEKGVFFPQYNSRNCEPLFVPGGSAMRILVPWKPVVLVWGLLSGMILVSFVASSLLRERTRSRRVRRKRALRKRRSNLVNHTKRLGLRVGKTSTISCC